MPKYLEDYLLNLQLNQALAQQVTEAEMYAAGDAERDGLEAIKRKGSQLRGEPQPRLHTPGNPAMNMDYSGAMAEDRDNRLALSIAINGVQPGDLDGLDEAQRRTINHLALTQRKQLEERDQLEAQGHTVIPSQPGFTGYDKLGPDRQLQMQPNLREAPPTVGADPREADFANDYMLNGHTMPGDAQDRMNQDYAAANLRGLSFPDANGALLRQLRARQMAAAGGWDPSEMHRDVY